MATFLAVLSVHAGWRAGATYAQTSAAEAARMVDAGFYPAALGKMREVVVLDRIGLLPVLPRGIAVVSEPATAVLVTRLQARAGAWARGPLWRMGATWGVSDLSRNARYALLMDRWHIGGAPGQSGASLFEASLIAFGAPAQDLRAEDFETLVAALPRTPPATHPNEPWWVDQHSIKTRGRVQP